MRSSTCALAAALAVFVSAPSLAAQESRQSAPAEKDKRADAASTKQQGTEGKSRKAGAPVVVLFPPLLVVDAKFSGGCWARLYSDPGYKGETLTLGGAGDYGSFKTSYANLVRKWDSIEVGPKATLTAYDNEDFTQPVATFKPAQRIADMDDKLGFLENIRSVRMHCAK